MDLVASKLRKKSTDEVKKNPRKKEHRAFPSLLLALNGLILPAANHCCMEIFLPFSLNDNYYTSLLGFDWAGPWHGHESLARSWIMSEIALSFAGKQMLVIFLVKKFSNLTVEIIWNILVPPALLS